MKSWTVEQDRLAALEIGLRDTDEFSLNPWKTGSAHRFNPGQLRLFQKSDDF
jgi:hypothetical protein